MDTDDPVTGRLLDEASWARRLARSLAGGDPHVGDDLAQEGLVAALERGPREPRALRAWLAAVLRNRARRRRRGEGRRADRERAAAREEALPSSEELASRAEDHRRVVDAVLALDEPYRATVLLRYLEELPPARIAERQGIPVSTVKTRLQRGLVRLRRDLEERHEDEGRGWLLSLAGLAPRREPVVTTAGGVVMATQWKWIGSVAALAIGVLALGILAPRLVAPPGGPPEVPRPASPELVGAEEETSGRRVAEQADEARASAGRSRVHEAAGARADALLTGTVVDAAGAPVAGASVEAWFDPSATYVAGAAAAASRVAETLSREDGGFELPLPAGRPHELRVAAGDMARARVADCHAGDHVRVTLLSPVEVQGVVVRADGGTPVPGGRVRVFHGDTHEEVLVDPQGAFELDGTTPGTIGFLALPENLAVGRYEEHEAASGDTLVVELPVRSGLTVEGRVTDALSGDFVSDAEVSSGAFFHKTTRADALGRYRLEGVESERPVRISARAPGYARVDVQLQPERHVHLDLALPPGREVVGRVVDAAGRPVAGASVLGCDPERLYLAPESRGQATTDTGGSFHLRDLPPDVELVVTVRATGHAPRVLTLPPGDPGEEPDDLGTVRLGVPASLEGRVVDASGEGVAGRILLRPGDVESSYLHRIHDLDVRDAWTEGDGRFVLLDLPAGRHVLRVVSTGRPALETEVVLQEGERRTGLEVRLPAGLAIEGLLLDETGAPVPAVTISVTPEAPEGYRRTTYGRTDDGGWFRVEGLEPGRYRVHGSPDGPRVGTGPRLGPFEVHGVSPGDPPLRIVLRPRDTHVSGRVVDEEGQPVPRAFVWVDLGRPFPRDGVLCDEHGRFRLPVERGEPLDLVARRTRHLSTAEGNLHTVEFDVGRHVAPAAEGEARLEGVEPGAEGVELRLTD